MAVPRYVAVDDPEYGIRIERHAERLVVKAEWLERPVQKTYAGLETRINTNMEELGCEVRLAGARPQVLPRPKIAKSIDEAHDEAWLEFVRGHDRGILRYAPGRVRPEHLVAQVAEAFPGQSILVVATRQNDVRYLRRKLKDRGLFTAELSDEGSEYGPYRVYACTYLDLATGYAASEHRDIVIYTNPAELFCPAGREGLRHLWRGRLFGLLPEGFQLPPYTAGLIAAVFGDNSISLPKHGRTARRVFVGFIRSQVTAKLVRGESELASRRRIVWHHEVRNRRIARIAEAFASADYRRLDVLPRELVSPGWDRLGGRAGVLVDSVEHGLALRRHLKNWRLLSADDVATEGLSTSDSGRVASKDDERRLLAANVIVTAAALPKAGRFDILIRADAGGDLPALDTDHLLGHYREDDGLLLIDFDDRHHPLVRKWTKGRKAAYEAAGWEVLGGPQVGADDRLHSPERVGQPVLPYQTPGRRRLVQGENRTAKYHYEKRRERRQEQLRREAGGQITLAQVADRDHLVDCFRKLQREGGPAGGIDGISPRQISVSEFGDIAEKLSAALLDKRWRPQKTRQVPIPKPNTTEKRVLKIGTMLDRVVGKALHEVLQPSWERIYLRNSFGFRPDRSVWQTIAELEATMDKYDCHVLVVADIRKAFDNVQIKAAIKAHQTAAMKKKGKQPMLADGTLELIETVLRGHDAHEVGIDQGGCYSPDALNTFLHVVHDVPLAVDDALLWFRYADNLVYAVQNMSEGRRVLTRVRRLLRKVGLELKEEEIEITDLDGAEVEFLGFRLWREDGRLRIGLKEGYLDQLREHLVKAWETSDPNTTANTVLRGWISANGPAFKNGVAVIADVLHLAAELGFRELPGSAELRAYWEKAWLRWRELRGKARHRVLQRVRP